MSTDILDLKVPMDFLTDLLIILNRLLFDFVIRGIDMGSHPNRHFSVLKSEYLLKVNNRDAWVVAVRVGLVFLLLTLNR